MGFLVKFNASFSLTHIYKQNNHFKVFIFGPDNRNNQS
jgi:hypothetical protein